MLFDISKQKSQNNETLLVAVTQLFSGSLNLKYNPITFVYGTDQKCRVRNSQRTEYVRARLTKENCLLVATNNVEYLNHCQPYGRGRCNIEI